MTRVPRHLRGTSLLEMLAAMGILASVLAIGVPNLVRLRAPYATSNGARQIVSALEAARQRAIARNTRYRVRFTNNSGNYVIERDNSGSWVVDGGTQVLPSGASVGSVSPSNPTFDSRGMLTGTITIPVSATGARTKTVTVNVLGHATIS
jgi:Tfp pilus assembly protein FimT